MSQPHNTNNNSSKKDEFVRIDLSETQKEQVKQATGKEADAIELNAQELEERIAPRMAF